jgi:hypothetical protein
MGYLNRENNYGEDYNTNDPDDPQPAHVQGGPDLPRDNNAGTDDSWFNGDYFQTFTGKHFYLLDPRPELVCIEDIAHALARTCRYGGHVHVENYSVAEHSVLVAEYAASHQISGRYSDEDVLEALLHDAGEAYYGDLKRPIKHHPVVAPVLAPIFAKVDAIVRQVFGLPQVETQSIKVLDRRIVRDEKAQVMAGDYGNTGLYPPLGVTIQGWAPARAEAEFLKLYEELTK